MRKALSVILLAAAALSAAAQQFNTTFMVDDASRVQILLEDQLYPALSTGRNEIPCLPGTRLTVKASEGNKLLSVREVDGSWSDELTITAGQCHITVFGNFGSTYHITSAVDEAAIHEATAEDHPESNTPLYHLNGSPASRPLTPGIYITADGKKIIL